MDATGLTFTHKEKKNYFYPFYIFAFKFCFNLFVWDGSSTLAMWSISKWMWILQELFRVHSVREEWMSLFVSPSLQHLYQFRFCAPTKCHSNSDADAKESGERERRKETFNRFAFYFAWNNLRPCSTFTKTWPRKPNMFRSFRWSVEKKELSSRKINYFPYLISSWKLRSNVVLSLMLVS